MRDGTGRRGLVGGGRVGGGGRSRRQLLLGISLHTLLATSAMLDPERRVLSVLRIHLACPWRPSSRKQTSFYCVVALLAGGSMLMGLLHTFDSGVICDQCFKMLPNSRRRYRPAFLGFHSPLGQPACSVADRDKTRITP